jgi:hypothetical protein
VYDTVDDATARAHAIKKFDNNFHVYIAEVGCWCPWSPYPDAIKDGEYAETQLNTLMKKYQESQDAKGEVYEQRKREMVQRMGEEREIWLEQRKQELATASFVAEDDSRSAAAPAEDDSSSAAAPAEDDSSSSAAAPAEDGSRSAAAPAEDSTSAPVPVAEGFVVV